MVEKDILVRIENGLHARPAAQFIKKIIPFQSKVVFALGSKKINAKSILNLMGVSILEGQTIRVIVEGEDEIKTLECIESFFRGQND
ncbi:HPr family phosphocarrier protein [Evansella tamaricis]|uniref:Phosphocarrier protein HPr n=1 Tax=Evansella tamaricis TaxID=2069301 RepID=A0ABS6JHC6_9BACI|nr:HPr family phosphocarrier protein [Evansella tamaricis]MBU9712629.1 HPr family phosphocarrier protein [Evansella tamaricis]